MFGPPLAPKDPIRKLTTTAFVITACLQFASLSCSSDTPNRPPVLGDCEGPGCTPGTVDSKTPGQDASVYDSGNDAAPSGNGVPLAGYAVRFVDDRFERVAPLTGPGSIELSTVSGVRRVDYGADAGVGFSVEDALAGRNWFHVRPNGVSEVATVFPTYSLLDVPAAGGEAFEIPVVDREVLVAMYGSLPRTTVLNGTQSQVIFAFETAGKRQAGISLEQAPTSEFLVYDFAGGFSLEAKFTGSSGLAILGNVSGAGLVRWRSEKGVTGSVVVVHLAGEASFVRVEVP